MDVRISSKHLHTTPPKINLTNLTKVTAEIATFIWIDSVNDNDKLVSSVQSPPSPAPSSSSSSLQDTNSPRFTKTAPSQELLLLCWNIIHRTSTPAPEVFTALLYLRKFRLSGKKINKQDTDNTDAVVVDSKMWMLRSAFIACIQLANKMLCDNVLSSRSWSKVTGVPKTGCTILETMMVKALHWQLFVSPEEYCDWLKYLIEYTPYCLSNLDLIKDLSSYSGLELTNDFIIREYTINEESNSQTTATVNRISIKNNFINELCQNNNKHWSAESNNSSACSTLNRNSQFSQTSKRNISYDTSPNRQSLPRFLVGGSNGGGISPSAFGANYTLTRRGGPSLGNPSLVNNERMVYVDQHLQNMHHIHAQNQFGYNAVQAMPLESSPAYSNNASPYVNQQLQHQQQYQQISPSTTGNLHNQQFTNFSPDNRTNNNNNNSNRSLQPRQVWVPVTIHNTDSPITPGSGSLPRQQPIPVISLSSNCLGLRSSGNNTYNATPDGMDRNSISNNSVSSLGRPCSSVFSYIQTPMLPSPPHLKTLDLSKYIICNCENCSRYQYSAEGSELFVDGKLFNQRFQEQIKRTQNYSNSNNNNMMMNKNYIINNNSCNNNKDNDNNTNNNVNMNMNNFSSDSTETELMQID